MKSELDKILDRRKQAKRERRKELFGEKLRRTVDKRANTLWDIEEIDFEKHPIGDQHPGGPAVALVREALSRFKLPSRVALMYSKMKRASGSGAHHIRDGVVVVRGEFSSLSGVKHYIDVPIPVHAGHMAYPEIFMHEGQPKVMAQSSFDAIVNPSEVERRVDDRRNMFSPESANGHQESEPTVGQGMFDIQAQQSMHDRSLDEAERDRSEYCHPGEEITLTEDVQMRGRGGTSFTLPKGTKGTVLRDMFGTGDVYYVHFENGCKGPVNKGDLD